ncbi:sigma-54-dependent transcriptional regulator [Marinilabilia salmonicolor]|uniref:sigma-54-dependent transcriptional regulator n=1 Tax=Marinilabilia salmonicolor TaxID=989 RepID=UPI00029A9102|nr:sigma-54 dependent transcriptional regulator [Marinilabilia salmonicolor]
MQKKILIVDDDTSFGMMVSGFLKKKGHDSVLAGNVSGAVGLLNRESFDLVLTDYRLPDGTGMDVLEKSKLLASNIPVVLITAYSEIRVAVDAIKKGAYEYITKPVNADELLHVVTNTLKNNQKSSSSNSDYLSGDGEEARRMEEHLRLVAPTEVAVLIQGESGTGKEYVARRIHELSNHADAPFVAVDCGALTPEIASSELFGHIKGSFTGAVDNKVGHFENVGNGTIFLDEVGNLSYEVQVKLLRAIQERRARRLGSNTEFAIEARIVAATNDDLRNSSLNGTFREDLYHRLNEFQISVPPLRTRRADLLKYSHFFLEKAAAEFGKEIKGFSEPVLGVFGRYEWPGNLRELRNVVRRSVLLTQGDYVERTSIPPELEIPSVKTDQKLNLSDARNATEKQLIEEALLKTRHNKSETARLLGMDRKTLYNKMQKLNIEY